MSIVSKGQGNALNEQRCIPDTEDADFVCAMEDILEVHHRPCGRPKPLVCFDEGNPSAIARPGSWAKYDYEYERNGTGNLFIFFAPLAAGQHVKVTDRRTMIDFAYCLRDLVDVHFPDAEKVVVVMDNLNTHKFASLYEAFPPPEACRISEGLEIHYMPKHGRWLNRAEIELSVLHRQYFKGRISDRAALMEKVDAWEKRRNGLGVSVHWRFSAEDVRLKLHQLYPSINVC